MIERVLRYTLYAVAIFACVEIGLLARAARLSGGFLQKQVAELVLPTQKLLGNATGAANGINTLVGQENKVFASQQAYFDTLKPSTNALFSRINDNLIPTMVGVLGTTRDTINNRSSDLGRVLDSTNVEVSKVALLTDAITLRVNDPAYDKMITDATQSMENLRSMTQSGSESLATVNKGVQYEYEQLTKPPKKIWIFVKGLASVAGNFFHL